MIIEQFKKILYASINKTDSVQSMTCLITVVPGVRRDLRREGRWGHDFRETSSDSAQKRNWEDPLGALPGRRGTIFSIKRPSDLKWPIRP